MKAMKRLINTYTLFIPLVIVFLLSGCENEESRIDTEIKIPVSVEGIKNQSIARYIETTGTVYSSMEGTIRSEITGKYRLQTNPATGKRFALGDYVKEGQLIVAIEDREFENNLQAESKKLNLQNSKNTLDKQKSLYDKGGVTLTELNAASIDYVNAKDAYEGTQIQKEKLYVRAPFNGIIVELPYHTQGVRLDQGQDLFKLMQYNRLLLDIKLPEKNLNEVNKGQQVEVTNYNLPDDTLGGMISQISPVIDPETRTFQSVLEITNNDLKLRPGMFVKVAILSEKRENTIVIPKETIISRQNSKVVFIVENGIAIEKVITTGLENQNVIEVLSGLKVNDRLVISGYETLRNKSKVSVIQ